MNMDSLISAVMNNLSSGLKMETGLSAKLTLADFMPQGINIKSGDSLLLNLTDNGNLLLTTVSGEKAVIPSQALAFDKNIQLNNLNEPVAIEAKAGNVQNGAVKLQITMINEQEPQVYLREQLSSATTTIRTDSAVIKDISNPQNLPLQNLKISDIAAPYIKELPVLPQQKAEIQTAMQNIELKFQVSALETEGNNPPVVPVENQQIATQITQKITEVLNQLPDKMISQPQAQATTLQTAVQQIASELRPLVGTNLPAETTINGFSTPIGIVQSELPIQLPEAVQASLKLIEVIVNQSTTIKQPELQSPLDKIMVTIEPLKTENPQLYQQITNRLPADNEQMLSNMASFTKAAVKGDVRQWLGQEVVQQLENQGQKGQIILNELQNVVQGSSRQTPMWRMVEIPYYFENHMEKIKLAVKQYPDEEETEENPREKFGTRFVVDTNFSQLGAFQFDGFSFAKDRRFDLIIRTQRHIDNDLCANIMRLFKTTLNEVQYTGNININLNENFIKISENTEEDRFLTQGLFI